MALPFMKSFAQFVVEAADDEWDLDDERQTTKDINANRTRTAHGERRAHLASAFALADKHNIYFDKSFAQRLMLDSDHPKIKRFVASPQGNGYYDTGNAELCLPHQNSIPHIARAVARTGMEPYSAHDHVVRSFIGTTFHEHAHVHHLTSSPADRREINSMVQSSFEQDVKTAPNPDRLKSMIGAHAPSLGYLASDTIHAGFGLMGHEVHVGMDHGDDYYHDVGDMVHPSHEVRVSEMLANITDHIATLGRYAPNVGQKILKDHFPNTVQAVYNWHRSLGHIK